MTPGCVRRNIQNINQSANSHINCMVTRYLINVVYLMTCALSGHDDVAFFK